MKSIITMSVITMLVIPLLVALALAGCGKNEAPAPADNPSTNITMNAATNLMITNTLPDMSTNRPASSNLSESF